MGDMTPQPPAAIAASTSERIESPTISARSGAAPWRAKTRA